MSSNTFHSQPTALAPMVSPGRPRIRTTYNLASFIPAGEKRVNDKFVAAVKCAIYWLKYRVPSALPQDAWDGNSFRLEWPGQKAEAISIPEEGIWCVRLEHPDTPHGNRAAVAGRTWTNDIGFAKRGNGVEVGIRTYCASLPYGDADVVMTRPRVVVELAGRVGLADVRALSREPWMLQTDNDIEELYALLCNPVRRLPVVMLTQPDRQQLRGNVAPFVLQPRDLAKRLLGVAHVVTLPWELGYKWTERVGKQWSAYLGAVRTYMPGLDFENDLPSMHPSTYADRIVFWKQPGDDRIGEAPFTDFLVERLFMTASAKRPDWGNVVFVSEARIKATEIARSKALEGEDWKALYEEEIAALQAKVKEAEALAQEYCDDATRTAQERDSLKEENRQLRFQVDSLRQALIERTGGTSESEIPIPDQYDEMENWANRHLLGRVVLHPRAFRGLKNALYEDVGLVYKSLLLLANEYRNQCLGRKEAKEAFKRKCKVLGLRFGRAITKERAGEEGDQYFVRFPTPSGPKHFLEWHLRKGSTKDNRHCLAIYFFWDPATQQVVVGWLPSHLSNRMT
ncbi:MAG: hypothetical protein KatS3mg105_3493 [Gemmatales bacterium]|nr:MAG: hypothetical protein KatS3mg105_3493 [Gemmatales bacterium]